MKNTGQLTKAILGFFTLIGFQAWENKTVGVYDEKRKTFRSNHNNVKGAPDIIAIDWHGSIVGVEVKIGTDRLSADQTMFAAEMITRNGVYIIASDIDSVIESLKFYGYDLNNNGYVRSTDRILNWSYFNSSAGRGLIPNSNKIKNLNQEQRAKLSNYAQGSNQKQKIKNVFGGYAGRII